LFSYFDDAQNGPRDGRDALYRLAVGLFCLSFSGVQILHLILILRFPQAYFVNGNHKYFYHALVFLPPLILASLYTGLHIAWQHRSRMASLSSWKWIAITCGLVAAHFLTKLALFYDWI
jgi:hypothetical protein